MKQSFKKLIRGVIKGPVKSGGMDFNRYTSIEGWLTPDEARGLFEIAAKLPSKSSVLEIGSWKGKSTWCIASGMKSGTINCIDPFNAQGETESLEIYNKTKGDISLLEQFKDNLLAVRKSVLIRPYVGLSKDFKGKFPDVDFLFIDGDHSIEGCRFDFENFKDSIKEKGFLAFHDYDPARKELGPTWVIENLVQKDPAFTFSATYDSLAVFHKM